MSMSEDQIRALPAAVPVKEVVEALGLSADSVYAAVRNGELRVIRIGRRILVPKSVLLQMLGMADEALISSESA